MRYAPLAKELAINPNARPEVLIHAVAKIISDPCFVNRIRTAVVSTVAQLRKYVY